MHRPSQKFPHGFSPPKTGNAPKFIHNMIGDVYGACRARDVKQNPRLLESKKDKSHCASIAWKVVEKKTGYKPTR